MEPMNDWTKVIIVKREQMQLKNKGQTSLIWSVILRSGISGMSCSCETMWINRRLWFLFNSWICSEPPSHLSKFIVCPIIFLDVVLFQILNGLSIVHPPGEQKQLFGCGSSSVGMFPVAVEMSRLVLIQVCQHFSYLKGLLGALKFWKGKKGWGPFIGIKLVIAVLLHPKCLVSFPRIPLPETIKLRIRGFFCAWKNSCRTCDHEVSQSFLVASTRGILV